MANARGIGRLGMLAVGLGLGAAVAHTPVASADTSTDWLSSIDSLLGGLSLPAADTTTSGLNLAISIDGVSLVSDGSAVANSGSGDIAIAFGADSTANAEGGTGDYALAVGSDALANAGGLAGDTGANNDSAIDIGSNPDPSSIVGAPDGAYAGNADLIGATDGGTGSNDTAIDIGNNSVDTETLDGGNTGAFAGAGGLIGLAGNGSNDTAIDIGNNSGFGDGPAAVEGTGNYVSEIGSTSGTNEGGFAAGGDNNTVIDNASYTIDGNGVLAGDGNDNYAYVDGPTDSDGSAVGTGDIAYVWDPFGSTASGAISGLDVTTSGTTTGDYDLAAVLLTDGQAVATDGNYVYDILSLLGNETSTAAATGGGFLAELLSLF